MRKIFILILGLILINGCVDSSSNNNSDVNIKITQFDFKYDYEQQKVTLIGEAKNIGIKRDNTHPWHGIDTSCYDINGKLLDTTGATVEILDPGETGTFKTYMFNIPKPYECKAKVRY